VWVAEELLGWVPEAGRAGLTPRVVDVTRKGKTFKMTVYVRPISPAKAAPKNKAQQDADARVTAALKAPGGLTAAAVSAAAADLRALPKERLREIAAGMGAKVGGNKAALADRLLSRARAAGPAAGPGDAPAGGPAAADAAVRAATAAPSRDALRRVVETAGAGGGFELDPGAEAVGRVVAANSGPPAAVKEHGMAEPESARRFAAAGLPEVHYPDTPAGQAAAARTVAALAAADLPPRLAAATARVVLTAQPNDRDAYWAEQFNDPGLRSRASGGNGAVVAYNGRDLDPGTYAHEAGHNLAQQVWGGYAPPPDSEYGRAQAAEPPVTDYGANSPAEDFAEAVQLYATGYQNFLRANYPKKFAALEKIMAGGT
jgi:hypothetical protein